MSQTVQSANTMFNRLMSPSTRVAGVVLGLIFAYYASLWLAPGAVELASDKITQKVGHDIFKQGWTEEKIAENPVGFLRYSQAKFEAWEKEVGKRGRAQQTQISKIRDTREELDFQLNRVIRYLNEGRNIYQRYTTNGETDSIRFAGRIFSGAEIFKKQLALLYNEKCAVETQIRQAESVEQQLVEKYQTGALEAADVRLKLQLIEPRIVLAQSSKMSYDFEVLTEEVEGLLSETHRVISEPIPLVSVSADLEKTDPNAHKDVGDGNDSNADFEAFLTGTTN